jgi:hypothetical protein
MQFFVCNKPLVFYFVFGSPVAFYGMQLRHRDSCIFLIILYWWSKVQVLYVQCAVSNKLILNMYILASSSDITCGIS